MALADSVYVSGSERVRFEEDDRLSLSFEPMGDQGPGGVGVDQLRGTQARRRRIERHGSERRGAYERVQSPYPRDLATEAGRHSRGWFAAQARAPWAFRWTTTETSKPR